MQRRAAVVVAIAVVVAGSAALPPAAAAKPKRQPPSSISSITAPAGLQGAAGAGCNVVLQFSAADIRARPVDVQVQFAVDENQDGSLTENEFHFATEDRLDWRNTRANKSPQLYPTAKQSGVVNAFIWKCCTDLPHAQLPAFDFALTPDGRLVPDPDHPGQFLGVPVLNGVVVRMRTVLRRKHLRPVFGRWVRSDAFALSNTSTPAMTIDSVTQGAAVLVGWTAYDWDSEDLNGNGALDLDGGEDLDNDGRLDCEPMGAAFDFHRLAPSEDPGSMTDEQLGALIWHPCTRLAGVGDTNTLEVRPGVPVPAAGDLAGVCSAPPGVGRHWTFAWDAVRDDDGGNDRFIVRATPFCRRRVHGSTVYSRTIVQLGD